MRHPTGVAPSDPGILSGQSPVEATEAQSLVTAAEALAQFLASLGVEYAFGVSGGAIGPIWAALEASPIQVLHFRHEVGACFAAMEAYFATGRPVAVFATTGPGITNALTGLFAARWDGAKLIFLSGATTAGKRGRWACQETSSYTMPMEGLCSPGKLFHYATTIESLEQLPETARRIAAGLARPGGFVAHLNLPTGVQMGLLNRTLTAVRYLSSPITVAESDVRRYATLLAEGPFALWVGFGARGAAAEVRELAERTGMAVMCSPRAKGIFPEGHRQFVGVTGIGGHESVLTYMREVCPRRTLVLGTRLGELTSFWNPEMVPERGFLHVDIDPDVPGVAYPEAETIAIQSDVKLFLRSLLAFLPASSAPPLPASLPTPCRDKIQPARRSPVRPEVLFDAIQQFIVEGSDAIVMADAGNTISWTTSRLAFQEPCRYRVSTGWGSMAHFSTGVVGAAFAAKRKAVAIVGDGAMLMNHEVSTAVNHGVPAVWIIVNDSNYNMCRQGTTLQGFHGVQTGIPCTDFAGIARAMGAEGIRVESEADLKAALERAMATTVPLVVDVVIDPEPIAPIGGRVESLSSQGAVKRSVSVWE
jgi:acetolactate synthase-1/2/3 large subunit